MTKRWNQEDKLKLMKLYASGKTYDEIGKTLKRTSNAIKLRLEAIVYENLIKGKTLKLIIKMLNTTEDNVKQLYYSHKSFRQSRGESVVDIDFKKSDSKKSESKKNDTKKIQNLISTLEHENYIYDLLIKNHSLKQQLNELYNTGKMDNVSMTIYKNITHK